MKDLPLLNLPNRSVYSVRQCHILYLGEIIRVLDVLLKILERFTYVDSDWLLFGKGEMIREHVLTEPNLFTNMLENRPNVQVVAENRKEIGVETPVNIQKQPVVEQVICQEKPSKKC